MPDKFQVSSGSNNKAQNSKNISSLQSTAEYIVIPPDGGWGWVVVAAAFFCQSVVDGILLTFGTYLHNIADTYKADTFRVSLIGSLMFGIHLAAGPVCAIMTQCMYIRTIVMIGGFMMAVAMAVPQADPPFWLLAVTFGLLAGVGMCLVFMSTIMITSRYFSRRRLIALGLVVCSTGAGTIIFVFAGSEMLKALTWQEAHLVLSGLSLLIVPASFAFRPLVPARIETSKTVEKEEVVSHDSKTSLHDPDEPSTVILLMPNRDAEPSDNNLMDAADKAIDEEPEWSEEKLRDNTELQQSVNFSKAKRYQLSLSDNVNFITIIPLKDEVVTRFTVLPSKRTWLQRQFCCLRQRNRVAIMHPSTKAQLMDDLDTNTPVTSGSRKRHLFGLKILRLHWKDTLKDILNCRILKNRRYCFFCISGCFSASGLIMVFTYEEVISLKQEHTAHDATILVATLGAANMFWRIFLGWVSTLKCVDYHAVHVSGMLIGGSAMIAGALSQNLPSHFFLATLQGIGFACFAVFRPVLLMEIVEIDKLTNATGLALMLMGFSSIFAPPLAGLFVKFLKDDYTAVLWLAGTFFILSGIFIFPTTDKAVSLLRRCFLQKTPENV